MGDFFRFLVSDSCDLDLPALESIFQEQDTRFAILIETAEPNYGELLHESEVLGEIELNRLGEIVFDEDISDLVELLQEVDAGNKDQVIELVQATNSMIVLQLTEAGHEAYDFIDPVWDVLFARCGGLLQVDDEGYYDPNGALLLLD